MFSWLLDFCCYVDAPLCAATGAKEWQLRTKKILVLLLMAGILHTEYKLPKVSLF